MTDGLHEHTIELREEYPDRLYPLLIELAEYNREEWLEGPKDNTIGADEVRKTGLTGMQKELADMVKERLERYEEWACDWCGVNQSTCTKGVGGPSLCNECAFGDGDSE
ncbi:hypothetical protein [Natronosalvus halobius]|uniref:hypothetical protein n=1 Tax=Natronosalvus halobius TaxID=2953746 RepID=UPI00209FB34D|nr:hypothetical protein [Natronosalvus halobius]USZ73753.1 hypothetical protein NGM15_18625 [Natronosalvus halobius]